MTAKTKIDEPTAEDVNPWHLIGYLSSALENHGTITKAGWNEAVQASRAFKAKCDQ